MKELSIEQLISKITHPNKKAFLENYPLFGISKETALAIGVSEYTIPYWLRTDKLFNDTFTTLKKELQRKLIEVHSKNIHDVALDTKTPAQSRIFGSLVILRAEEPEKWREKPQAIPLTGEITVIHKIPRPPGLQLKEGNGQKGISEGTQEEVVDK